MVRCHIRRLVGSLLKKTFQSLDVITNELRGVVICKLEPHRSGTFRGYIAMLATVEQFRGRGIATKLVCMAIDAMKERDADEVSSCA